MTHSVGWACRAYGTRAVASAWWVFALVISSSYTANLATLLAKKSTTELFHDVEGLVHSPLSIDYGCKKNGSTYTFFEVFHIRPLTLHSFFIKFHNSKFKLFCNNHLLYFPSVFTESTL